MSQLLTIRKDVPSGTIAIDHDARSNALSSELVSALQQALDDFQGEKKVRAVILTGHGDAFCTGTDLKELNESFEQTGAEQLWQEQVTAVQELLETMLRYPKPIVAGVNGWTVGSGLALMLACDIAIAADSAKFALPEAKLGLVAGLSAPLLSRKSGTAITNEMLATGTSIDAPRALRHGLINEVVAGDLVWARAHELALAMAKTSPTSHLIGKQLLNETIGESLFTELSIGAANTAAARSTEQAREGVDAFIAKRLPRWDDF